MIFYRRSFCFSVWTFLMFETMCARLNIARGKDTKMSSRYGHWSEEYKWGSHLAVDGIHKRNVTGAMGAHTQYEPVAWWAVNLGKKYNIDYVTIYSHTHTKYSVYIYNPVTSNWNDFDAVPGKLCYQHIDSHDIKVIDFTCKNEAKAKFLQIYLNDGEALFLSEVEVYVN